MELCPVQDNGEEDEGGLSLIIELDRSDQHNGTYIVTQGVVQILKFNPEKGGDCEKLGEYNIFSSE